MDSAGSSSASTSSSIDDSVLLTIGQVKTLNEFHILNEIGEGSFSTVMLALIKSKNIRCALKVCSKAKIQREKKVKQIFRERNNLRLLSTKENQRPFIVTLYATFQDDESLYFVLSYAPHRDIGEKMRGKVLETNVARFLVAEICLALGKFFLKLFNVSFLSDYIHSHGILHRDVKPENLLVKENYHIMLSDFGSSIQTTEMHNKTTAEPGTKRKCSFVGSHLYVCPEVLNGENIDETCDYFSVGSIVFEMLVGNAPFYDLSEYLVFRRIVRNIYSFPDDFHDAHAKDLIKRLLHPVVAERLGTTAAGGFATIQKHAFFESVRWNTLVNEPSPFERYFRTTAKTEAEDKLQSW